MEQMNKLKSDLFKKFEDSKLTNLTACIGGAWYNSRMQSGAYDRYNNVTRENVITCAADDGG